MIEKSEQFKKAFMTELIREEVKKLSKEIKTEKDFQNYLKIRRLFIKALEK